MKLLNQTLLYTSVPLLLTLSIWASVFYVRMLNEVYDSLDDGLGNYKLLIIQKAQTDSSVLHKTSFEESNYLIQPISRQAALFAKEVYKDTLMYMENEEDYEPVRLLSTVFNVSGKFYKLQVISSMVEEDDQIENLVYSLAWLYVALLATILLINNSLLKRIWKPFYHLLAQVRQYQLGGDKAVKPMKTSIEEFRVLNETIASLIEKNVAIYMNQKQFIENAAHELQTPLAIGLNKLELLAESDKLSESGVALLESITQNLQRLTRLNKSLLLLSKIENKQFPEETIVDFSALFNRTIEDFQDLAEHKGITIRYVAHTQLRVSINKALAEIVVGNLLKNAILHNIKGGSIVVELKETSFSVSNTGRPHPLNAEKVFSRFYKESSEKNTTGLGLAIVKAIADVYKWRLEYSYKEVHVMTVWLA